MKRDPIPARPAEPPAAAAATDIYAPLRDLDRLRTASLARMSFGLSPQSLWLAWSDWAMHLATAPGKQIELAMRLSRSMTDAFNDAMQSAVAGPDTSATTHAAEPTGRARTRVVDPRFAAPAWRQWPFNQWAHAFVIAEDWWRHATNGVPGTDPHHEAVVSFMGRQWLDMMAPSNLPWANPEVLQRSMNEGGGNLVKGASNLLQDFSRRLTHEPPPGAENFVVGKNVAATPGKVVMRTHLVELIQYAPTTKKVYAEPILLVPAWIMKYYILDLSAHNSLIRWLVEQGHTVYCLSWRNVTREDRDLGLDDYRTQGVMAALDTIEQIEPGHRVHAAGYCLGGTLLAIAAAAMTRAGDKRLASMTLLAAQTDFSEPGELELFIDPSQVHMLESGMWQRGYLAAEQMAGAFQMLQSNDLIWSRMVREYMLGERSSLIDLMAWNADATRMPFRMHTEYLRRLFLRNELATGRIMVDGHPIALQNVHMPIFAVGTERDHVAPWRSVYKIHYLADSDVTFVLTNGGHNAGIVSEPGRARRHYRELARTGDEPCLSPDEWLATAPQHEGSWWPAWQQWLARHSSAEQVTPPKFGGKAGTLGEAPGEYVLQR